MKYLHLDCEMGGRELKYSLLTACFIITDDKFNILDELSLATKPTDGDYIVSGQGMAVNKINLLEHDKIAVPYKVAGTALYNFLKKNVAVEDYGDTGVIMTHRLTPVGHGVKGDISHLIDKLISEGSWEQFCTYHFIDTSVVLQFLRACGKMSEDCDGSVGALAKYFEIPQNGELHDARVDTMLQAMILKKFVELGK
jgi:hypothetical protein